MSAPQLEISLPTLARLNSELPKDIDPAAVASEWFDQFARRLEKGDGNGVAALLLDDAFWRDTLALTWDFRTFHGSERISRFINDVFSPAARSPNASPVSVSNLVLAKDKVSLQTPYPDLAWVHASFSFETSKGHGFGIVRLVPTSSGAWKAHVVYTNLEELKGFPELVGPLRSTSPNHGDDWLAERQHGVSFEDSEPAVVVVGGGHSGLEIAARLKYLGVPTLVVEKHPRVGDSWRVRYEALSLHDPVYYIRMPYLSFPSTWPLWSPAPKIADWLEFYANALDLNVWTSTNVEKIEEGAISGQDPWNVHVVRANGEKRILKPRHVVFATGLYGGPPRIPEFPGTETFKGKIIHTTQYKTAREHEGKKVVVIGACTSGHDVSQEHAKRGIDVTMVQRESSYIMTTKNGVATLHRGLYDVNSPPPDVSDRIGASFPYLFVKELHKRQAPKIAELDKELLDGLRKRGFKLNMGEDDSGVMMLYLKRGGGYYLDTGASQLIVDGKIKLKSDSLISRFKEDGFEFENGSFLPADVVILATGYEGAKEHVKTIVSQSIADRINTIWGLNDEGELNTVFRYSGVEGLYFAMGNFAQCRFYSKLLALQIKAQEEGVFGPRYSK